MKCQILFSRKIKKVTSLSSANFGHSMVSVTKMINPKMISKYGRALQTCTREDALPSCFCVFIFFLFVCFLFFFLFLFFVLLLFFLFFFCFFFVCFFLISDLIREKPFCIVYKKCDNTHTKLSIP